MHESATASPADREDLQGEIRRLCAEREAYRAALLQIQARGFKPVALAAAPSCYDNAQARAWLVGFEGGHAALAAALAPLVASFER